MGKFGGFTGVPPESGLYDLMGHLMLKARWEDEVLVWEVRWVSGWLLGKMLIFDEK